MPEINVALPAGSPGQCEVRGARCEMLARRAVTSSVHVQVRGHVARSESAEKGNGVPPPSSRTSVRPCSHAHRGASLPMQRTWPAWRKDCRLLRLRSTKHAAQLRGRARGSRKAAFRQLSGPISGPGVHAEGRLELEGLHTCTHARASGAREGKLGARAGSAITRTRRRRALLPVLRSRLLPASRAQLRPGRLAKRLIAQLTILVRPGAQRPSQGFAADNAACKCRARPQANARVGWPLAGLTYVASVLSGCTEKSSGLIAGA